MARARTVIVVSLLTALGGAGCQTFIDVQDVESHLPRLDGTYLLAIKRTRVEDASATVDVIRARALASLDAETRTLDLNLVVFKVGTTETAAEITISDVEFPADSTDATFPFNLQVPLASVTSTPAPTGRDLVIDVPDMLLRAEGAYSFCGQTAAAAAADPSFGTVLLPPGGAVPPDADTNCDQP